MCAMTSGSTTVIMGVNVGRLRHYVKGVPGRSCHSKVSPSMHQQD